MANLLGQNIGTNYKGILNLDTINTPLDATLRAVTDGEGNASPLQLSTDAVSIGAISGARLAVKGSGTTFNTTALLVKNSPGTDLFKVLDSGSCVINGTLSSGTLTSQRFFSNVAFPFSLPFVYDAGSTSSANTSGVRDAYKGSFTYLPTSGTGELNIFNASPTINQTGGANGITRGLFINPTLTAAADFRAIETTNGKVVFGNLPTSAAGLPSGAIWNNSGVINIV